MLYMVVGTSLPVSTAMSAKKAQSTQRIKTNCKEIVHWG